MKITIQSILIWVFTMSFSGFAFSGTAQSECDIAFQQQFEAWLKFYRQRGSDDHFYLDIKNKIDRLSEVIGKFDIEPCSGGTQLVINKLVFETQAVEKELEYQIKMEKKRKNGDLVNGERLDISMLFHRWLSASKGFEDHLTNTVKHFHREDWLRRKKNS